LAKSCLKTSFAEGPRHDQTKVVRALRAKFDQRTMSWELLRVDYVGAPLSGQVAADVKGRWKTLERFGPNDGLTLLADEILNSGRVVFEIGQDHYFRDPEIDLKALALACLVLEQLAKTTFNG
jgi:hypothetical protein